MVSSSERKDVRRLEKVSKVREAEDRETLLVICATSAGRRWFWDRLSEAHIFVPSFTGEALASAFNEGQRSSGLKLLAQLQAYCPEQFTVMMQEANVRDRSDTASATEPAGSPEPDSGTDWRDPFE